MPQSFAMRGVQKLGPQIGCLNRIGVRNHELSALLVPADRKQKTESEQDHEQAKHGKHDVALVAVARAASQMRISRKPTPQLTPADKGGCHETQEQHGYRQEWRRRIIRHGGDSLFVWI